MAHDNVRLVLKAIVDATAEPQVKKCFNVWDYRRTAGAVAPVKANIISAWFTQFNVQVIPLLNQAFTLQAVEARFIDDFFDAFVPTSVSGTGATTDDCLPSFNAVTWQLKTGLRGRSYRGSKHFSGLGEDSTLIDLLTGAAQTAWDAAAAVMLGGFTDTNGNTWKPQVVSAKLSDLETPIPLIVANLVTGIVVNPIVGTMRHRKQKAA